jgi:hypothetical protein
MLRVCNNQLLRAFLSREYPRCQGVRVFCQGTVRVGPYVEVVEALCMSRLLVGVTEAMM